MKKITNILQTNTTQPQTNQLELLQEQLRLILATSSDGIALVDSNHRFIEVNPAFSNIFGRDISQLISADFLQLFENTNTSTQDTVHCQSERSEESPSSFESNNASTQGTVSSNQHLCTIRQALEQQQALPYLEADLTIKGMPHTVGLTITPLSTNTRSISLIVVRDVTVISDTVRLKSNFLSMVTHELRSPLNAIHGYLDLALTGIGGDLNAQQREFVQRARSSSEYLYALIEDILLISRADSGQIRVNLALVKLQDIVANAIEELEWMAVDNDISMNVEVPYDFPPIYADPVRMQQVLRNLISNALRFTPSGGNVTIAASIINHKHNDESAPPDAAESSSLLQLDVIDTGYGIAQEQQQRIFERFYQVPQLTSGRTSGLGLGLAIVKMIVELHRGQIHVTSTPQQGSTFTCLLPCLLS